ncbi:MAG: hypothetical protein Q7S76_03170 [bacterium]|nr:hypothetical protein [bacterium]
MKPYVFGILGTIGLMSLYFATMTILNGLEATIEQFQALWWLMVPLATGFGIQVGLVTKLRTLSRASTRSLVAGGSSGSVAMLACCAHHITDILPMVGLSAASIVLLRYQPAILVTSFVINVLGVFFILKEIKKHSL